MKKITRNIATLMILTLAGTVAKAQVVEQKVGDNNLIMNQNAVLEIESSNRGLLLPRLALTATDAFAPLTAHVEGMTVYNTATAGTGATAVTPGYYYNDGTQWVRVATGADAKTEPWFVQNTANEATANTDNIYQQGKVAVGFDEDDVVSEKQFEVKGDMKSEFVDTDDYVYGFQTARPGLDPSTKENLMYVTDNENLSAANHYSMIGVNKDNATFIAMDKTGAHDKAAIITASNIPGGSGGVVGMASETTDGGKYVNVGGLTWTDEVEGAIQTRQTVTGEDIEMDLLVRPKTGISFKHQGPTGYGAYTFPTNSPTEGQVLVGSATTGGSVVGRQLEWKDVNDLVSVTEPWRIQNTTTDATANTDNIYQQGKVAVGFTDADTVSDKQLDVKGDFRTLTEVGGRYAGIETNLAGTGMTGIFNSNDIDNPTQTANILVAQDIVASLVQTESSLTASLLSPTMVEYRAGSMDLTDKVSNLVVTEHSILLQSQDAGAVDNINRSTLHVGGVATNDIQFSYSDGSGNLTGRYIFPKTAGTVGQVLGVATSVGNVSTLEWTDAGEDTPAGPWLDMDTDESATDDSEDIYFSGNVAIGASAIPAITVGSETVNPKLHIAGDVSTTGKLYTTNSVFADYVFEKYFDGQSEINAAYEFKSLDYIKEFVKNNKHLPGVTKIDDLLKDENGYMFDMTELSIQQLEKIEELFLHVIEQNEQIIELKNQVEDNNKRLEALENLLLDNNSK